jgi:uncharacterized protein (DUF1778 family)
MKHMTTMRKTEFLQIRLSPEDRSRLEQAANANHLDLSTWARQAILRALDEWERANNTSTSTIESSDQSHTRGME